MTWVRRAGGKAVVTAADGTVRWVDMPTAGAETFLKDYSAGGGKGAIWRFKRVPKEKVAMYQYGYNQARAGGRAHAGARL